MRTLLQPKFARLHSRRRSGSAGSRSPGGDAAVGDVVPRSGCGAGPSTCGGATGPAPTPAAGCSRVTRVHRDTATHWHLPLATAGVASPEAHARMCLPACLTMFFLCWLNRCMLVAACSGSYIVLLQSWLATAALAECARRPRTARHARHAAPSALYNAWCIAGNCRLGPTSWRRSFCEQRSSSWSCSPGVLLTKAAMLWRMPARSHRRRPHAETAAAAAAAVAALTANAAACASCAQHGS